MIVILFCIPLIIFLEWLVIGTGLLNHILVYIIAIMLGMTVAASRQKNI